MIVVACTVHLSGFDDLPEAEQAVAIEWSTGNPWVLYDPEKHGKIPSGARRISKTLGTFPQRCYTFVKFS